MDQIIQTTIEQGIPVASFIALIYYIFWDKKQTNAKIEQDKKYQYERDEKFLTTLESINENMIITNERLSDLEKRKEG